jgi:hypothetical protein
VVLVREVEEAARDTALLEDVEQGESVRHGETVVEVVVDDEVGGVEL